MKSIPTPKGDRERYEHFNRIRNEALKRGDIKAMQAAWLECEKVKNKNFGHVPK